VEAAADEAEAVVAVRHSERAMFVRRAVSVGVVAGEVEGRSTEGEEASAGPRAEGATVALPEEASEVREAPAPLIRVAVAAGPSHHTVVPATPTLEALRPIIALGKAAYIKCDSRAKVSGLDFYRSTSFCLRLSFEIAQ
jgi:hypothetical protein